MIRIARHQRRIAVDPGNHGRYAMHQGHAHAGRSDLALPRRWPELEDVLAAFPGLGVEEVRAAAAFAAYVVGLSRDSGPPAVITATGAIIPQRQALQPPPVRSSAAKERTPRYSKLSWGDGKNS